MASKDAGHFSLWISAGWLWLSVPIQNQRRSECAAGQSVGQVWHHAKLKTLGGRCNGSGRSVLCFSGQAPGSIEAAGPIGGVHALYSDPGACARRVYESSLADVYADMAVSPPLSVEENQIAGFERLLFNCHAMGRLQVRAPGKAHAECFLKHGSHEATAIEAGLGSISPIAVRRAEIGHGIHHQQGAGRSGINWRYVRRSRGCQCYRIGFGRQAMTGQQRLHAVKTLLRRLCLS